MNNWSSKSRRILGHTKLLGKSFEEKFELLPKLTGIFNNLDWNITDINLVNNIYTKACKEKISKGISEQFYNELYLNLDTYKKFCYFGRCIKLVGSINKYVNCAINNKFCTYCLSNFTFNKSGVCSYCTIKHPLISKNAKNAQISISNTLSWNDPIKNITGKRSEKLFKEFGVRNVFQLPETKIKRIKTLVEQFGKNWQEQLNNKRMCTNEIIYNGQPLALKEYRDKGKVTLLKETGYDHPMRNPVILLKVLSKSRHIYTVNIQNRDFKVQGKSELAMVKGLIKKFGVNAVHTQFHDEYPCFSYSEMRTMPDFYIDYPTNVFVECKSNWTFMGRDGTHARQFCEGDLNVNIKKARIANNSGNNVRWVIHHYDKVYKKDKFLTLPLGWYDLEIVNLRILVNNFTRKVT